MSGMRSRTKIIDATIELIAHQGFAAASIAAVAKSAGVSRQTVYSIFGSREDLVSQSLAELATTLMSEVHTRLDGITDLTDYLIEFLVAGRSMSTNHPVLSTLMSAQDFHPFFDDGAMERTRAVVTEFLRPMTARQPQYEPYVEQIVDMVSLLGLSLVVVDDTARTDDEMREFLEMWLRPAITALDVG